MERLVRAFVDDDEHDSDGYDDSEDDPAQPDERQHSAEDTTWLELLAPA